MSLPTIPTPGIATMTDHLRAADYNLPEYWFHNRFSGQEAKVPDDFCLGCAVLEGNTLRVIAHRILEGLKFDRPFNMVDWLFAGSVVLAAVGWIALNF